MDAPAGFPGVPADIVVGDPRVDGGWRPWERRVLTFLAALRSTLESESPESFAEALRDPEHSDALARLHRCAPSCDVIEARIAELQQELHGAPSQSKAQIVKQIRALLAQLGRCDGA